LEKQEKLKLEIILNNRRVEVGYELKEESEEDYDLGYVEPRGVLKDLIDNLKKSD
jgi:hypothetical protein